MGIPNVVHTLNCGTDLFLCGLKFHNAGEGGSDMAKTQIRPISVQNHLCKVEITRQKSKGFHNGSF